MKTLAQIEAAKMRQYQQANPGLKMPDDDDDAEGGDEEQFDGGQDPEGQEDDGGVDDALTKAEQQIAELRHQMAALQGRLTPAQQQSEEYRRMYQEENRTRQSERQELEDRINALTDKLDEVSASTTIEDLLTEEERDMFDPEQLSVFAKIADGIAKRRVPKVDVRAETLKILEERKAQEVRGYRDEFLSDPQRGLSDLGILADTPDFRKWLAQEENDDFDPLVNSFLVAKTPKEIDRLGKAISRRVAKFKEGRKKPAVDRKSDAQTSHTGRFQRRPQAKTELEMKSSLIEAKRLSRSRDPEDRKRAREILDSLN